MVSNCKDTVRYVWTRQVEWMDKQHTRGLNSGSGSWFNPPWGGWRTGSIRLGAVGELVPRSALGWLENWFPDPLWAVWKLVWSFKKIRLEPLWATWSCQYRSMIPQRVLTWPPRLRLASCVQNEAETSFDFRTPIASDVFLHLSSDDSESFLFLSKET